MFSNFVCDQDFVGNAVLSLQKLLTNASLHEGASCIFVLSRFWHSLVRVIFHQVKAWLLFFTSDFSSGFINLHACVPLRLWLFVLLCCRVSLFPCFSFDLRTCFPLLSSSLLFRLQFKSSKGGSWLPFLSSRCSPSFWKMAYETIEISSSTSRSCSRSRSRSPTWLHWLMYQHIVNKIIAEEANTAAATSNYSGWQEWSWFHGRWWRYDAGTWWTEWHVFAARGYVHSHWINWTIWNHRG